MAESDFAKYLDSVNSEKTRFVDEGGRPYEGSHVFKGEDFGVSFPVIMNFKDGYLDSDGGKRPAVEYPGWIEYWRNGKRHRNDGLPAVSKEGFKYNEIWINGQKENKV